MDVSRRTSTDQINKADYEFEGFRRDSNLQILIGPAGEPIPPSISSIRDVALPGRAIGRDRRESRVDERSVAKNSRRREQLKPVILTLRKMLGESASDRRFILTVPGRGFKFVAPVRAVPHEPYMAAMSVASQRPATAPEVPDQIPGSGAAQWISNWKRWRWPMVLVGACIVLTVCAARWLSNASRPAVASPSGYQPLTDVVDSATAPALSPDGRMLVFIRNGAWMLGSGQIWARTLPYGEDMRLTSASCNPLFAPTIYF